MGLSALCASCVLVTNPALFVQRWDSQLVLKISPEPSNALLPRLLIAWLQTPWVLINVACVYLDFALDTAINRCVIKTIFKLPANCASLIKIGTTVICQGCINGFALSKDKLTCKAPITTENSLSAMIGADDKEICTGCKSGFAFKGLVGKDCATAVPAAATGCARLSDDRITCLNSCNAGAGFWMSDVNKCSK